MAFVGSLLSINYSQIIILNGPGKVVIIFGRATYRKLDLSYSGGWEHLPAAPRIVNCCSS